MSAGVERAGLVDARDREIECCRHGSVRSRHGRSMTTCVIWSRFYNNTVGACVVASDKVMRFNGRSVGRLVCLWKAVCELSMGDDVDLSAPWGLTCPHEGLSL